MTGFETLLNAGLKEVISIEAAKLPPQAHRAELGTQKAAAVVSAIAPSTELSCSHIGVSAPTDAQFQPLSTTLSNSLVAILNAVPAPTTAS